MTKKFVFFAIFVLFFFVSISSSNGDSDLVFQNYININLTKFIDGDGGVHFKNYSERPYVGISDERILKRKPNFGWQEVAIPSSFRERKLCDGTRDSNVEPICGRPLGLTFDSRTCHLYLADAYFDVSVLYDGLAFPNGVAFSANNSFLLVNESIKRRILKFNVHDPKAAPKVFLELPRVLDNIKRNEKGEFWVALNSGRLGTLGNGVPDPIGMRFNEEAKVLEILDGKGAPTFNSISEVEEYGGKLYIGSVLKSYVGILNA
ncbi:hypothetical protein V6Z11_A11G344700 [Gossypium hirsutum]